VNEGEALIQTVFNAIWGNQKVRNSTLLVIVYDEHGGLYDHVPQPTTVTPDGRTFPGGGDPPDPPFDFTRLGVRVPAILISPYIQAGVIDHTVYDHTSVIATARKLLIPNVANSHLTLRDKLANTFEGNLTLAQPRNDAINLNAPQSVAPTAAQLAQLPSTHLQTLVAQACMLEKVHLAPDQQSGTDPQTIKTEAQASTHLQGVMGKIRALRAGQAGAAGAKS
jgi:phospholipase C